MNLRSESRQWYNWAWSCANRDDFPEFDDEQHLQKVAATKKQSRSSASSLPPQVADHEADHKVENFPAATSCVVYGLQHRAVQGMMDFDFMCT
jgi:ATP citrate (pro-S)-lyase